MSALDYTVVLIYLGVVAAIGLSASRSKNVYDYILGSRSIPWWAAGISVIATETSALTLLGAPIQSLRGDWTYLQLAIGSVLGRVIVSYVLLTAYYRAGVYTVYDYLAERFGPRTRDAGSGLFYAGRVLGSGVRLYGAAIALVVVVDLPFPLAIALIGGVAVLYTIVGGIRSVIWTDVLQGVLLVGSGVIAIWLLLGDARGLASALGELGSALGPSGAPKLRLWNLSLDPRDAYTLAAGVVGSAFLTMSTHGTDQDMIQRCFTVGNEAGARRSLLLSATLTIPIAALFLAVGSLLWLSLGGDAGAAQAVAQIAVDKGLASPDKGYDFLFPYYVVQSFPAGLRGAIVAAIFAASMSSLDSAMAALSSTGVRCLWQPYFGSGADDARALQVSRWMSAGFGALIIGVALWVWLSEDAGSAQEGYGVLQLGLQVLSWIFPPLLGIFLVGVLSERGSDLGNLCALATGVGTLLAVTFSNELFGTPPPFAWSWNSLVGCALTAGVALLFRGAPREAGA